MNLRAKLLLSYLVVIAPALLVLALSTAFIAPVAFGEHVENMRAHGMLGAMLGMRGVGRGMIEALSAELDANFREAVNRALLLAAAAATVAAAVASWIISRRIVRPLREIGQASQHIAEGHYDERLAESGGDELGELTRSFNRMAAALADTEAMRQQLLADVSHELKTPLASIKGYMEGLQDGVIPPTPETFQLVYREADRLQRLVHDLQELSRAQATPLPLDLRPQDANALATSALDWIRPQFDDGGIMLESALLAEPQAIRADFDRVRQVLLNLLGNALQYTPSGGRVTLRLSVDGSAVRFAVRDTGIGLAAEDLERVFQRFYRVDKSRARASGGSGIGLTIARSIVEAHGGHVEAESAGLGQGSTFSFTIPLA
jgi:signal transduction histidine kinase